jgi:multicomponent Na+:H+ antiporter subunit D
LILLSSLLAVIYVWRVVEAAYFKSGDDETVVREAPFSMLVPIYVLTGASLYFGVDTSLPVGVSAEAAKQLLGIGG